MSVDAHQMTGSLEDYLESIYRILAGESVARVGDIAEDMGVSPASVSPAMKRLADMGLVRYSKRRYVELTPAGEETARKTLVRHNILTRFLGDVLGMDVELAERDACAMEHFLSDEALMGFAALFESTASCPAFSDLVQGRLQLSDLPPAVQDDPSAPVIRCPLLRCEGTEPATALEVLSEQPPGTRCLVGRIHADSDARAKLVDLGFIQGAVVVLVRPGARGLPCVIELDGHDLEVDREMASSVLVSPAPCGEDTE